jgi:hypothetical protein
VTARGETGTFVIYDVDGSLETAELKQMSGDLRLSSMPWDALTFLNKKRIQRSDWAKKATEKPLGSRSFRVSPVNNN